MLTVMVSEVENGFEKVKKATDSLVDTIYEYTEAVNKKRALNTLKNIVFVLIDEIEEGNINKFSLMDSGIIPKVPDQWGVVTEDDHIDYFEGEEIFVISSNSINVMTILNEKAFYVVEEIMKCATFLVYSRNGDELQKFLKLVNDYASLSLNEGIRNNLRICKYGRDCYRTTKEEHISIFCHPWIRIH